MNITVYALDVVKKVLFYSLPEILAVFECEDEGLDSSIRELIAKFDPDSPYWKVHNPFLSYLSFIAVYI